MRSRHCTVHGRRLTSIILSRTVNTEEYRIEIGERRGDQTGCIERSSGEGNEVAARDGVVEDSELTACAEEVA